MLQSPHVSFIKNKSKGLFNMDNRNNMEEIEQYTQQIKELFKELVAPEIYDNWVDEFEIEKIRGKKVFFAYYGTRRVKKFKKQCKKALKYCVRSIIGKRRKIKIRKRKMVLNTEKKKNIKALRLFVTGMFFVCLAIAIIVILGNYIGNRNFRETFYSASSIKVNNQIRVIQVSDLHTCSYGENNKQLLKRIEELAPDIIICTGDIVDYVEADLDYAVDLAGELSKIAPSYYIYGNNEVEGIYNFPLKEKELDEEFGFDRNNRDESALQKVQDSFEEELENAGIKVLKNEKDTIKVKSTTIDVYGVLTSNPSSFWSYSGKSFENYIYEDMDNLKITAIHEPYVFEEFQPEFWGDLMVCGHTHGGVVRVPILGPMFTKEGGLFPERSDKFVYGRYDVAGRPLIVSSGLENLNVLRINNQPELVIIDINKF